MTKNETSDIIVFCLNIICCHFTVLCTGVAIGGFDLMYLGKVSNIEQVIMYK